MRPVRRGPRSVRDAARVLVAAVAFAVLACVPSACSAADVARWSRRSSRPCRTTPTPSPRGSCTHDGRFYESSGRYGRSDLREVDPETGAVVRARPSTPASSPRAWRWWATA
jgi:glutamine cyclotransferase